MPNPTWPLASGAALTRWIMTKASEIDFPGHPRAMPDRVDYRFENGFVDVGDLPCREAWLACDAERIEPVPQPAAFNEIYVGPTGIDVDFSTFRACPTLIRRYLRLEIFSPIAQQARFSIATCGRVQLFCGSLNPITFAPRKRNTRSTQLVDLALVEGHQQITVMLEDLHERDTLCMLSLVLVAGVGLTETWAADDGARIDDCRRAMQTGSATLTGDRVKWLSGVDHCALVLSDMRPFERGALWDLTGSVLPNPIPATSAADGTFYFEIDGPIPAGAYALRIVDRVGDYRMDRQTGLVSTAGAKPLVGETLDARKSEAIERMLAHRAIDPSTALVALARGRNAEFAATVIERVLTGVEIRQDCSDFNLIPLLIIYKNHRDALPEPLGVRLHNAVAQFRYWLDIPGNDVMWFWSENHVLCFHVCQHLAAGCGIRIDVVGGDIDATDRLHRWFDAIDSHGLAEWNSAAYYPIDLLALLALRDHSDDEALVGRADRLLDELFVMIGLHCSGGVPAGSQGRAYEKELLAGPASELGPVTAVAFGGKFCEGFDRAVALFCLSDYVPPAVASDYARPRSSLRASYRQGLDGSGCLNLWKSAYVQLSTAKGSKPGSSGHQQHVVDVQFANDPWARVWINAAGDTAPWGGRRPSFLAGNAVMPALHQFEASAWLIYQGLNMTINLYLGGTELRRDIFEDWVILRCGQGYAGIWCSQPLPPTIGSVLQVQGDRVAWVLKVAKDDDYEGFVAECVSERPVFDGQSCRLSQGQLALDAGGQAWIDDVRLADQDRHRTPQISLQGGPWRSWRDGHG